MNQARTNPMDGAQRIAVVPGDGIGPEVMVQATRVLEAVADRFGIALSLEHFPWSADHYLTTGETLPAGAMETLQRDFAAILVGAFGDPRVPDMRHAADILLGLRRGLDLYINFRPIKLYDARLCPLKGKTEDDIDLVVLRENTEGAYSGAGGVLKPGTPDEVAIEQEINTRKGVERILRAAFEHARSSSRRRVCMADKSNAMRHGGGLWQRCFAEVSADYPEIEAEHRYIDTLALELVRIPERYDVIVTNNLFGDIITDLGAALQGGLGVAASANLAPGRVSLFEPVHGSAPDLAGQGRANPIATVLSVALMLDTLGHVEAAQAVEAVAATTLRAGVATPDVGGQATTAEVGDRMVRELSTL